MCEGQAITCVLPDYEGASQTIGGDGRRELALRKNANGGPPCSPGPGFNWNEAKQPDRERANEPSRKLGDAYSAPGGSEADSTSHGYPTVMLASGARGISPRIVQSASRPKSEQ